jgi:hypothetical protein
MSQKTTSSHRDLHDEVTLFLVPSYLSERRGDRVPGSAWTNRQDKKHLNNLSFNGMTEGSSVYFFYKGKLFRGIQGSRRELAYTRVQVCRRRIHVKRHFKSRGYVEKEPPRAYVCTHDMQMPNARLCKKSQSLRLNQKEVTTFRT